MTPRAFRALAGAVALATTSVLAPPVYAVHLYQGCGPGNLTPAPPDSSANVSVIGAAFVDSGTATNVTVVPAGGKVTWTWLDSFCHSVTSANSWLAPPNGQFSTDGSADGNPAGPDGTFVVEAVGSSSSFSVTFPTAGVFWYYCVHHRTIGMRGVVIVVGS
jgi:plastocyanin